MFHLRKLVSLFAMGGGNRWEGGRKKEVQHLIIYFLKVQNPHSTPECDV
jgi:hypothetical protein